MATIVHGTGTIAAWDDVGKIWDVNGTEDGSGDAQEVMISMTRTDHDLNASNPASEVGNPVTYTGPEVLPGEVIATAAHKKPSLMTRNSHA